MCVGGGRSVSECKTLQRISQYKGIFGQWQILQFISQRRKELFINSKHSSLVPKTCGGGMLANAKHSSLFHKDKGTFCQWLTLQLIPQRRKELFINSKHSSLVPKTCGGGMLANAKYSSLFHKDKGTFCQWLTLQLIPQRQKELFINSKHSSLVPKICGETLQLISQTYRKLLPMANTLAYSTKTEGTVY